MSALTEWYNFLLTLNRPPHHTLNNIFYSSGKNKAEFDLYKKTISSLKEFTKFMNRTDFKDGEKTLYFKLRDIIFDRFVTDRLLFGDLTSEENLFDIDEFQTLESDAEILVNPRIKPEKEPITKKKDHQVINKQVLTLEFTAFEKTDDIGEGENH